METKVSTLKAKVLLAIDGATYEIRFPLPSVKWLEDQLKHSMRHPWSWLGLKTEEIQPALQAGLLDLYPDDAESLAERVSKALGPEEIQPVVDMLCAASFPEALGRFHAECQRLEKSGQKGVKLPNVPSVAVN